MLFYDNTGVEGKVLYTLYSRRPDEPYYTGFFIYLTQKGSNKQKAELDRAGLEWEEGTLIVPDARLSV